MGYTLQILLSFFVLLCPYSLSLVKTCFPLHVIDSVKYSFTSHSLLMPIPEILHSPPTLLGGMLG